VISSFLTDRNGVIAKADKRHNFHVPLETRNTSDWQLYQELIAQADVIISGAAYLKRVSSLGSRAENILTQFEPGGEFGDLGQWRLSSGYQKRNPDLAVVTRSLDFTIPEELMISGRRIIIFTTDATANSDQARALTSSGIIVIGSGKEGVDGNRMIETLSNGMGYRVIMMASGPSVLELLLEANRLDILYITEAQLEIPFDDPSSVLSILPRGKKVNELNEFSLIHQYLQENVVTEDGSLISQLFLRYDRKGNLVDRPLNAPESISR
jgi:riboflavin biosynthesis pyrimidine reductase